MSAVSTLQIAPLTTVDAANMAGVKVATIRKWVERGTLTPVGRDQRGRPLFDWRDLAAAERATRDRAIALGKTRTPFAA